ncbi:MAG: Ku protein [Chloroflexi bacterium]|nr:Ku protein [Chloroflexota bacterium]
MARPIWKGAISFGMVSIPIRLYTATEDKDVGFNLLHKQCHTRIRQQRYCPSDEKVIEWGDVVRGFEYAKDQYVVLEEADFQKVPVASARTIEITSFVGLADVDPQYYERSYYLEPEELGKKPYVLLRRALEATQRVAVAKVSIRQKEQLCLLRPKSGALLMHTMFYPDEIRAQSELALPDETVTISDRELQMAHSLVEMLTAAFDPTQYKDAYREALLSLIEQKVQGAAISQPPAPQGKVVDLMAALRASLEEAKKERSAKTPRAAVRVQTEESRPQRRRKTG